MKSFAQLLTEHIQRSGVSDAELARHLGVRRQTIFRWKEGLVRRPRRREDVIRLAAKLRLSDAEMDAFLLSAGFAPTGTPLSAADIAEPMVKTAATEHETTPDPITLLTRLRWLPPVLIVLALAATGWLFSGSRWRQLAAYLGISPATPVMARAWPTPAASGETLLIIAAFANYGGEASGYNVAGRLRQAIDSAVTDARLERVRVETAPTVVTSQEMAEEILQSLSASLLIWGEYDSGRVLTNVATIDQNIVAPELLEIVDSPADLSTVINTELPSDLQWMALIVLGKLHTLAGRYGEAHTAFQQALARPIDDERSLGSIYFYLGWLENTAEPVDYDQKIAYYSRAIALNPGLVSALSNRGASYFQREAPGDLERAEADFRRAIALAPDFDPAHFNLAMTLRVLEPTRSTEIIAEFERVLQIDPDSAAAANALCWYYSLNGRASEALPLCEAAVARDDSGYSHDSRGLALALLGRYKEAVADFQYFLDRLQQDDSPAYERYRPSRQAWIETLQQGRNPFDEATLHELLNE